HRVSTTGCRNSALYCFAWGSGGRGFKSRTRVLPSVALKYFLRSPSRLGEDSSLTPTSAVGLLLGLCDHHDRGARAIRHSTPEGRAETALLLRAVPVTVPGARSRPRGWSWTASPGGTAARRTGVRRPE